VVVRNLNLMSPIGLPDKANTVLIIDSDAMLAHSASLQSLQPITWRNAKIHQIDRCFDLIKLAKSHRSDSNPALIGSRLKERLGIVVFEALNHDPSICCYALYVKRYI
jgi:hypothetical protein